MANFGIRQPSGPSMDGVARALEADKAEAKDQQDIRVALAETEHDTAQFAQQLSVPRNAAQVSKTLKARGKRRVEGKGKTGMGDNGKIAMKIKDLAKQFKQKNDELNPQHLEDILNSIRPDASEEEITDIVSKWYPDPFLANDVFEFLDASTDLEMRNKIRSAHDNYKEKFQREIEIGQNITSEAKTFGTLDTPDKLREWYRSLVLSTSGQMKTTDLFLKMMDRFGFDKLVKATNFYLVALGQDLRNKGIQREELTDKMGQVKSFQAIINVFRMSSMRMRVIPHALEYYAKQGHPDHLPEGYNYQKMGMTLMTILQNRHLNKDMILQIVRDKGFQGADNKGIAMTVVVQQMSLMIRDLDVNRVFTSDTHRVEVEKTFKECLEELYANAQPEETYEWLSESALPADLGAELGDEFRADFGGDESRMGTDISKMREDPELSDFMRAFDNPESFLASAGAGAAEPTRVTSR